MCQLTLWLRLPDYLPPPGPEAEQAILACSDRVALGRFIDRHSARHHTLAEAAEHRLAELKGETWTR